jgi:hypothetical protein
MKTTSDRVENSATLDVFQIFVETVMTGTPFSVRGENVDSVSIPEQEFSSDVKHGGGQRR